VAYPSLYRAKAVSIRSGAVEAFVPQVFGESTITITDSLGALPVAPGMGWVFFQAGNPEFPVWSSGLGSGNGNGDGQGAGVNDEVWIGPSAPPGEQELWVDTDEEPGAGITTAWKTLTLQNSWLADASYQTPQYRKVGDRVELRGQMVKTAATSPTGQYPFMLSEAAHQPPTTLFFGGVAYQSTPYAPDVTSTARLAVLSSGQGYLAEITPARINPSISLNSISWSVTP
jgi:hypothetical protein